MRRGGREGAASAAPFLCRAAGDRGLAPGLYTGRRKTQDKERRKMTLDTTKIFEYLDQLRESGEVNMFGSAAYVQEEFELSRKDAQRVVEEWMQQFSV